MTQQNLPGVIEHRGFWESHRQSTFAEQVYSDEWRKENNRIDHFLSRLVSPPGEVRAITQRDAQVAADVVRWLGSNLGRGFISACEGAIEKGQKTTWLLDYSTHDISEDDQQWHTARALACSLAMYPEVKRGNQGDDLRAHAQRIHKLTELVYRIMEVARQ